MPMPWQICCRHGSREPLRVPVLSRDVSSPSLRHFQLSGHPFLLGRNSSSLTVVFVTMQKGLRFTTAQLHRLCSCKSWAVLPGRCPSNTFTDCGNVVIPIKHFALGTLFKYRVLRFMFISSLSRHGIFRAVSFTLYMMSVRSWHM